MATESSVGVINQTGAQSVQVDAVTVTPVVAGTPIIGQTNYRQAIALAACRRSVACHLFTR